MKIPPRHMFLCQALGTAIGSTVNYSFIKGIIASKRPYLDGTEIDPTGQFTGRGPGVFYSASVIWVFAFSLAPMSIAQQLSYQGLVGPARFFTGNYSILYWGFLIGLVAPFIPWYIYIKYPRFGKKFHLNRISFPSRSFFRVYYRCL